MHYDTRTAKKKRKTRRTDDDDSGYFFEGWVGWVGKRDLGGSLC